MVLKEAKPCPFCGNDTINIDEINGQPKAWCTNCAAEGPTHHFGPDGTAAGAWNDLRAYNDDASDDDFIDGFLDALSVIEGMLQDAPEQVPVVELRRLLAVLREEKEAGPEVEDLILGE